MDLFTELKKELKILIYGNRLDKAEDTVKAIAEDLGRSVSGLSRMASLHEEQPTPIEVLLPLMLKRKRFRALEMICWKCGGVFVRLPKSGNKKQDDIDAQTDFHTAASEAAAAFSEALKKLDEKSFKRAYEALRKCASESMAAHKYAEQKQKGQFKLEL